MVTRMAALNTERTSPPVPIVYVIPWLVRRLIYIYSLKIELSQGHLLGLTHFYPAEVKGRSAEG